MVVNNKQTRNVATSCTWPNAHVYQSYSDVYGSKLNYEMSIIMIIILK